MESVGNRVLLGAFAWNVSRQEYGGGIGVRGHRRGGDRKQKQRQMGQAEGQTQF